MQKQKGISTLVGIIIIIVVAIIFFGGVFAYQYLSKPQILITNDQQNPNVQNSNSETATWKTYTNAQYGFSIQYPSVGDIFDKGKDTYGIETILVGMQSNSADVQRSLKIDIQKAKTADDCSENFVRNFGLDFKDFSLSGVTFLKADLSSLYNKGKGGSVYLDEYCTVYKNTVYRLTTSANIADVKGVVYSYSDFEKDATLNKTINSFKFTK